MASENVPNPVSASRKTPGSTLAAGGPVALKPSAGDSPPRPGRYRTIRPTTSPANARGPSGHHKGADSKPSAIGRPLNAHCCREWVSWRNPYDNPAIGAPSATASAVSRRYPVVRITASASGGERRASAAVDGSGAAGMPRGWTEIRGAASLRADETTTGLVASVSSGSVRPRAVTRATPGHVAPATGPPRSGLPARGDAGG